MALSEIDRRLLDRCLRRDAGAWEEFVDRFAGLLLHVVDHTAIARAQRIDRVTREDLAAEILLALVRDDFAILRRFQRRAALATYLTVVARRIAARALGSRRHRPHTIPLGSNDPAADPLQDHFEDAEQVAALLAQLNDLESRVVQEHYLHGRTYREIAERLQVPENSVGPTLSRARRKLLESLAKESRRRAS